MRKPQQEGSSSRFRLKGIGKDAAQGWLDISKLVSGGGKTKTAYDKLASLIGAEPITLCGLRCFPLQRDCPPQAPHD